MIINLLSGIIHISFLVGVQSAVPYYLVGHRLKVLIESGLIGHQSHNLKIYCSESLAMLYKRNTNCDKFKNARGIYYLFDDKKNIIYIGCSSTIGNRIKAHKRGKNKPYKPFRYFSFSEIDVDTDIYYIEALEINFHLPKFNLIIPNIERFI